MNKRNLNPSPPAVVQGVARLKIIKGPYKGVSYKLVAQKITIGRSSDNDIALVDDDKCSRQQALIKLESNNSYSIRDLSKRSSVKVNNMVKLQSDLQDGDLIQFGSTVLQFEINEAPAPAHIAGASPAPIPLSPAPAPAPAPATAQAWAADAPGVPFNNPQLVPVVAQNSKDGLPALKQETPFSPVADLSPALPNYGSVPYPSVPNPGMYKKPAKKKGNLILKIILIGVALAGAYLFLDDSENIQEQQDKLKTTMDTEENIKTLSELREKEQEKRNKIALPSYKNAQFAYISGIRDYRKGVYIRAIESFRVCKILYPQHDLCASYLKKAEIKNQQLIQAWMVAGKDYREKRRFVSCMSSFKNVMMAIKDKHNLTYKEAGENYKICQIQYEDRY